MRYKEFKEFERTINKIKQLIKEGQIKSAVERALLARLTPKEFGQIVRETTSEN